jgi:hypothetical protein
MPLVFDPLARRILLDSTSATATDIYSRWVDWASSNLQYEPAFRQVGGDDLGGGLSIPPYYFLQNGWRVRPMEASHNLTITGNLFVQGGGVPVVPTLGVYQVNVNYTVPVQAQGINTSGGGGLTAEQAAMLESLARVHGLIDPLQVSATLRTDGTLSQTIGESAGVVTVTRTA